MMLTSFIFLFIHTIAMPQLPSTPVRDAAATKKIGVPLSTLTRSHTSKHSGSGSGSSHSIRGVQRSYSKGSSSHDSRRIRHANRQFVPLSVLSRVHMKKMKDTDSGSGSNSRRIRGVQRDSSWSHSSHSSRRIRHVGRKFAPPRVVRRN